MLHTPQVLFSNFPPDFTALETRKSPFKLIATASCFHRTAYPCLDDLVDSLCTFHLILSLFDDAMLQYTNSVSTCISFHGHKMTHILSFCSSLFTCSDFSVLVLTEFTLADKIFFKIKYLSWDTDLFLFL